MTLVTPCVREEIPELEPVFQAVESTMGFVPDSMLTMAHWPELLRSVSELGAVLRTGSLSPELRQLVAFVVSNAAGCRYCQAHTLLGAKVMGVSASKIQAAFEFESSPLFSEAERAALRVAMHAGMVPNAVEPVHVEELRQHYSERQCVEIVAVISFFGFLNRWNDTLATTLEDKPGMFASSTLATSGWEAGKHQ